MRESKQGGCCLISCVNSVQGTYVRPVVLTGYGGNDFASRVMSSIGQCLKTVPLPKLEGVATGIQRVEGRNDAENSTVHRTAPQHRTIQPHMSTVWRMRNTALDLSLT